MYKYKTRDGSTGGIVPGVGVIVDGEITSDHELHNPNLICVEQPKVEEQPSSVVGVEAQRPNTITDAQLVQPQNEHNGEQA